MKILNTDHIMEIHETVLSEFGGLGGVCPDKSLESALNRLNTHIFYTGINDLFEIAALLGEAIAQGHIFNDGNKRTAFASVYEFLLFNHYVLKVTNEEIVEMMVAIAEKSITRQIFVQWLKEHSYLIEAETEEEPT